MLEIQKLIDPTCSDKHSGEIRLQQTDGAYDYFDIHYNYEGDEHVANSLEIENLEAGTYEVFGLSAGGCKTNLLSVELEMPSELALIPNVERRDCDGTQAFFSLTASQPNDLPNLRFQIDEDIEFNLHSGVYLDSGNHLIILVDSSFCHFELMVDIPTYAVPTLNISDADTLFVPDGEALNLSARITDDVIVRSYYWYPDDLISEYDSLAARLIIGSSGWINLVVEYDSTCFLHDSVYVLEMSHDRNTNVYIPNGFSPNGDGINDYLEYYAAVNTFSLIEIKIYDRFGNKLINRKGESLDNRIWDGKVQGKDVGSGVYVLQLTYRNSDGTLERLNADVTVIR